MHAKKEAELSGSFQAYSEGEMEQETNFGYILKIIGVLAILFCIGKACNTGRGGGGCTPEDGSYSF